MDLYEEIILNALHEKQIQVVFVQLEMSVSEIVQDRCYKALKAIKLIIEDDSLEDAQCYEKVEQIVRVFEESGSDGGNRHDFG